jgi:plastocyanin
MILARLRPLRPAGVFATLSATPTLAAQSVTIRTRSDAESSQVGFEPVGLLIQPGQIVRFVCEANQLSAAMSFVRWHTQMIRHLDRKRLEA